jgi:F-type H+-transporting ATPase subunit delta
MRIGSIRKFGERAARQSTPATCAPKIGMKISKQAQRDARQLFRSCQQNNLLDENRVRQTVSLLAEKKPRGYVEILSRLHRLVKLDLERRAARVESALPLPADLQNDVTNNIKKIYGDGVNIVFGQNPALLGGLRIQVGSDLYDGSVKTRLNKLEQSF